MLPWIPSSSQELQSRRLGFASSDVLHLSITCSLSGGESGAIWSNRASRWLTPVHERLFRVLPRQGSRPLDFAALRASRTSRASIFVFSRRLLKRPGRLDGKGKAKSAALPHFAFHTEFSAMLLYQSLGYR